MTELLAELLGADLIDKVGTNDDLFSKITRAAEATAQQLRDQPALLVRAVLAGLDEDSPADDPSLMQAEQALLDEWKLARRVFADSAVNLHRAILLEACHQAAEEGSCATILWLTAADTLPLLRVGRQEPALREVLTVWAERAERYALQGTMNKAPELAPLDMPKSVKLDFEPIPGIDRDALKLKVAAAAGPNYRGDTDGLVNPNDSWSHNSTSWAWEFTDRMTELLENELDALSSETDKLVEQAYKQLAIIQESFGKGAFEALAANREATQAAIQAEQTRLSALWWSQALYSSSLRRSYRELSQELAAVIMALDLLGEVTPPTPASVGYLLAEAVNRLPEADYTRKLTLRTFLGGLRAARADFPTAQLTLIPPPAIGHLSLRDLAVLALTEKAFELDAVLARAGNCGDFAMSLPEFSRALFRQEQAIRLATQPGAAP